MTPYSDSVSLRLAYWLSLRLRSKSLTHYTKGTQSHAEACSYSLYANGFRFYFTPLTGVLFAFPSRYWFTIGRQGIFSLGGWSLRIPTGFHVSRSTWERWPERSGRFRLQGSHLLWRLFPEPSAIV